MTGYTIETNGTRMGTKVWDAEGNDISADTYRIVIDVHQTHATIELGIYTKNEHGSKHVDPETGEIATETTTGVLTEINGRSA